MISSSCRRAERAALLCALLAAAGCRTVPVPVPSGAAPPAAGALVSLPPPSRDPAPPAGEDGSGADGSAAEGAAGETAGHPVAGPGGGAQEAAGGQEVEPPPASAAPEDGSRAAAPDPAAPDPAAAPPAFLSAIVPPEAPEPTRPPAAEETPAAPPQLVGGGGESGGSAGADRSGGLEMSLRATPAAPRAGEMVTVEIMVTTAARIVDAPVRIAHDPSVLRYAGAEAGPFLQGAGDAVVFLANGTARPGEVSIGIGRGDRARGRSGSGVLCRIRFEVQRPGNAALRVAEGMAWTDDGRAVPVTARPIELVAGETPF